jgi:hypothetical protein
MNSRRISILLMLLSIVFVMPAIAQDWNVQIVDDSGDVGQDSQIIVLSDGTPYIAYKASGYIRLTWWVENGPESGWVFTQLEQATAGYAFEMLVDSADQLHLVWCRSYNEPRYGIYDPASELWALAPEAIPGMPGYAHTGMTLTEDGGEITPHVIANADGSIVWVGVRDPGTGVWEVDQVSSVFNANGASSLGVDSTGGHHVSFYDPTGDNLMYAVKAAGGSEWLLQSLDLEGNVGEYSNLIVDDNDDIHIAYYDRTNGDLKFATSTLP